MKKTYIAIGLGILVLLAVLVSGGSSLFTPTQNDTSEKTSTSSDTEQTTRYSFTATRSGTVLQLMQEQDRTELEFKTKEFSGLGVMIEEINGLPNKDGYYWILYINGSPSDTGAESAKVSSGDVIEWKYEKGY